MLELAGAAPDGTEAIAAVSTRLARPLVAADAAAVVRWHDGRASVLAADGDLALALDVRPPEGASVADGRPVAAVSIDPRTDLLVTRSAPIRFADGDLEALRALGTLVRLVSGGQHTHGLLPGLATRVVASLETDEVLVSTADAVSRLVRAEIAGVLLLDASGEELAMRCAVGNTELDTARLRVRVGQGLAGRVLESGQPERIDDYSTDPRSAPEFLALSDIEGTCSALAVPLSWDGRIQGVLCAWRRRRAPFTDEDQALLEAVAELCGAAIHNAGTFEDARSQAKRAEAAREASEARYRAAERELHVYAELTRIAMEGDDVRAVVRAVSTLTKSPAVVVTDDGRVLGSSVPDATDQLAARVEVWVRTSRAGHGAAVEPMAVAQEDGSWMLVAPVRAAGVTFGHLALHLDAPPGRIDELSTEQAAVVIALLLAREEAAVAAARRLQSEFVWDLLDGRLPDAVEAGVRARHLGAGFALPARLVALEVSGLAEAADAGGWTPEHLERSRSACSGLITRELEQAGVRGAVLARRADLFAIVVPCPPSETLSTGPRRLARALARIRWPDGVAAAVGVGGRVDRMDGFSAGWREAQLARSAVRPTGEPEIFEDLGVLQFLLAPTSRSDLDAFAQRLLGPLLAYDADHGTELMRTLIVYLDTRCSTRQTAEVLMVHHRTVAYRIGRITELTSLRLDDQDDRFHVQLACKILALGRTEVEGS